MIRDPLHFLETLLVQDLLAVQVIQMDQVLQGNRWDQQDQLVLEDQVVLVNLSLQWTQASQDHPEHPRPLVALQVLADLTDHLLLGHRHLQQSQRVQ